MGIGSSSLLSRGNKGLQWPDPDFSQEAKNMDFKCWQLIQSFKKTSIWGKQNICMVIPPEGPPVCKSELDHL